METPNFPFFFDHRHFQKRKTFYNTIAMAEEVLNVGHNQCVVCVEEIDGVDRLQALGACNHVGVCRYEV